MKRMLIRVIIGLVFSSVALSGCALEYRQHRTVRNNGNDRDHNRDRDRGHDNRNYYHN